MRDVLMWGLMWGRSESTDDDTFELSAFDVDMWTSSSGCRRMGFRPEEVFNRRSFVAQRFLNRSHDAEHTALLRVWSLPPRRLESPPREGWRGRSAQANGCRNAASAHRKRRSGPEKGRTDSAPLAGYRR